MRLIGISRCDGDPRTPKYFDATLGYNNGAASLPTRIVVVVLTRVESWSLSVVVVTFMAYGSLKEAKIFRYLVRALKIH